MTFRSVHASNSLCQLPMVDRGTTTRKGPLWEGGCKGGVWALVRVMSKKCVKRMLYWNGVCVREDGGVFKCAGLEECLRRRGGV